jgi:hypothetical protein
VLTKAPSGIALVLAETRSQDHPNAGLERYHSIRMIMKWNGLNETERRGGPL